MRRFTNIDNVFMIKHELTLQEAYILEWILALPMWANKIVLEKKTLFFASKNKACQDLMMITKHRDTMQRYYRKLETKELIKLHKVAGKDYIEMLDKCLEWNKAFIPSDNDQQDEEIRPGERKNTSNRPTNSNTNNSNSNIEDNDLFGNKPVNANKKTIFKNSLASDIAIFKKKLKEAEHIGVDVEYYYRAIDRWSRTKTVKRTADGWIATAETWMEKDKDKGSLKMVSEDNKEKIDAEMRDYMEL